MGKNRKQRAAASSNVDQSHASTPAPPISDPSLKPQIVPASTTTSAVDNATLDDAHVKNAKKLARHTRKAAEYAAKHHANLADYTGQLEEVKRKISEEKQKYAKKHRRNVAAHTRELEEVKQKIAAAEQDYSEAHARDLEVHTKELEAVKRDIIEQKHLLRCARQQNYEENNKHKEHKAQRMREIQACADQRWKVLKEWYEANEALAATRSALQAQQKLIALDELKLRTGHTEIKELLQRRERLQRDLEIITVQHNQKVTDLDDLRTQFGGAEGRLSLAKMAEQVWYTTKRDDRRRFMEEADRKHAETVATREHALATKLTDMASEYNKQRELKEAELRQLSTKHQEQVDQMNAEVEELKRSHQERLDAMGVELDRQVQEREACAPGHGTGCIWLEDAAQVLEEDQLHSILARSGASVAEDTTQQPSRDRDTVSLMTQFIEPAAYLNLPEPFVSEDILSSAPTSSSAHLDNNKPVPLGTEDCPYQSPYCAAARYNKPLSLTTSVGQPGHQSSTPTPDRIFPLSDLGLDLDLGTPLPIPEEATESSRRPSILQDTGQTLPSSVSERPHVPGHANDMCSSPHMPSMSAPHPGGDIAALALPTPEATPVRRSTRNRRPPRWQTEADVPDQEQTPSKSNKPTSSRHADVSSAHSVKKRKHAELDDNQPDVVESIERDEDDPTTDKHHVKKQKPTTTQFRNGRWIPKWRAARMYAPLITVGVIPREVRLSKRQKRKREAYAELHKAERYWRKRRRLQLIHASDTRIQDRQDFLRRKYGAEDEECRSDTEGLEEWFAGDDSDDEEECEDEQEDCITAKKYDRRHPPEPPHIALIHMKWRHHAAEEQKKLRCVARRKEREAAE